MNIKSIFSKMLFSVLAAFALTACVQSDEWETPPINCENKFANPTITMSDFAALAPSTGYIKIDTDQIFDGYVISSDESGNFYKTISFQDDPSNPTVGLQMEVDRSGNYADFPVGSHIRINANGLRLGYDRGVLKIGSEDPTYAIGRVPASLLANYISGVCGGNGLDVQKIIPVPLSSLAEAKQAQYINILVTVPSVQFTTPELGKTYINYIAGTGDDTDRNLEDTFGNSTVLRNSGFAAFGSTILPRGNGDITFVVSRYNSSWQMLIRDLQDVQIPESGPRYDAAPPKGGSAITYSGNFSENFESYSTTNQEDFPKYINDSYIGNRYWQLKSFSGNKYIQLSAFNAGGDVKTYFIVPVDFTAANTMSFKTKYGFFNGHALKVYTTTNYTPSSDIATATLTDITSNFTFPTGPTSGYGSTFTNSGNYSLPTSLTGNGYIVFEYSGGAITTTVQIDDIVIN